MPRSEPFKPIRVDLEIYRRVDARRKKELRRDKMTAYIEYILDLWGHYHLVEAEEVVELRKQNDALRVLLDAKNKEAAELHAKHISIEPEHPIGSQARPRKTG